MSHLLCIFIYCYGHSKKKNNLEAKFFEELSDHYENTHLSSFK